MLLTTQQTAERLEISIRTLHRLIGRGEVHSVKVVGWRGLRFDSDEIDRFQAGRVRPTSTAERAS